MAKKQHDIEEVKVARALEDSLTLGDQVLNPEAIDPKTANVLYHDWESKQYDDKWSISFDERCINYARDKFLKVAPDKRYGRVLEIGAGTGFFVINLAQAGLVHEPYATDISPGMVDVCLRNAQNVGISNMMARVADAEDLPFEDDFFDLVVGHAVIHHLPDVEAAFREALRVLKPGGAFVIAGEPTRVGFQLVGLAKRATAKVMKTVGARIGVAKQDDGAEHDPEEALEAHVDLHEFHPHMVEGWLKDAGFTNVRVTAEELVSALWGWSVRTFEALARPGMLGARWANFAYRSYLALYKVDEVVTERVLPRALFYNLLVYAEKPKKK